uniref:Putative DNA-binding domain-containing protein n=1 Tax=uncultured Thiotrichaceae bacterium TaxID=298394 RepID=A0A6S6TGU6_9GAMM|nr:MAG: Unknown protein [uncultured Thiotrichaceae bacterium]
MNTPPESLKQLQTHFSAAVFSDQRELMAESVIQQGELSAEQRVGIYCNSVHGILWQYLASLYPVCNQLVGEKFFEGISDLFIDQQPPNTPFLADYGRELSVFMREHEAFSCMLWVNQVAELEWARHQAWNHKNQGYSDFSRLATLTEEQQLSLQFQLPESMQLLHSPYAVHQIWLAHQPKEYSGKIPLEEIQLQQEDHILVWRAERQLQQMQINQQQWQFLNAVRENKSLAVLSEQFQEQIGTLLSSSIQNGWIISFK